jgi:hypothetical protein
VCSATRHSKQLVPIGPDTCLPHGAAVQDPKNSCSRTGAVHCNHTVPNICGTSACCPALAAVLVPAQLQTPTRLCLLASPPSESYSCNSNTATSSLVRCWPAIAPWVAALRYAAPPNSRVLPLPARTCSCTEPALCTCLSTSAKLMAWPAAVALPAVLHRTAATHSCTASACPAHLLEHFCETHGLVNAWYAAGQLREEGVLGPLHLLKV